MTVPAPVIPEVRTNCLLELNLVLADWSAVEPDPVKRTHYEREALRTYQEARRLRRVVRA